MPPMCHIGGDSATNIYTRLHATTVVSVYEERYSDVFDYIRRMRGKGLGFDELREKDDGFFETYSKYEDWPDDTRYVWSDMIDTAEEYERSLRSLQEMVDKSTLSGDGIVNTWPVPTDEFSNWQLYRSKLIDDGFSNVDNIQVECHKILNNLCLNTEPENPVKGMVVGYVQSGKTANMAGLMSMAADSGFNFFIVLSGTIDSLRVQTRDRLYLDLSRQNCNNIWMPVNYLSPEIRETESINTDCKVLNVCLKNQTRLRKLINWLNSDLNRKTKLRMLVIDDEADQATINTSKEDEKRKTVNDLIMKLVNCQDLDGNQMGEYGCMNYIQYTATPYANFLCENAPESLYPQNFVILLTPSDEYFGPHVIYGDGEEYPGLDIVDTSCDIDSISKRLLSSEDAPVPESLRDAIAWFICCVCVARLRNYVKPVSMLIHTTQFTEWHKKMGETVVSCLNDRTDMIDRCERVYIRKTAELTKEDFSKRFAQYGLGPENVDDYPPYSEISDSIVELVNMRPAHIGMKDEQKIVYKKSIHICIDNTSKDDIGIDDEAEEHSIKRLIYPSAKDNLDFATAFIIVGGNTLSRGLTIQGLVSTYFGRTTGAGDSLMQMGRWFGYRKGYELLPRLWMSKDSLHDFETVSQADKALRQFIRDNYDRYTPRELPPMVRTFPKSGHLRSMTSASKSRGARLVGYDFSGCVFHTNVFDRDASILKHNEDVVKTFVSKHSDGICDSKISKSAKIIYGVPTNEVCDELIRKFRYNDHLSKFKELDELIRWIGENTVRDWNIILGGRESDENGTWSPCEGIVLNCIERNPKHPSNESDTDVMIRQTLASPDDRYADALPDRFESDEYDLKQLRSQRRVNDIRACCGIIDVPILIIYCISKKSLGIERDAYGITIQMPGVRSGRMEGMALQLPARTDG